jgi:UDP-N-acetylglucosamine 2-epimerase (non-hydrolysing)/GDP/UDP-N,N'-diacetylbacillosamine 2-epimerase (hydrolysing)
VEKKKVMYISGTRADYGLMRSVLRRVDATRGLSLSIIATGMHLSREFGYTIREIERDGFKISAKIPSLRQEDTGAGMLRSFSTFLTRLVNSLERIRPDVVLLLGDRWEMLAGAMAGSYMNRLVAHIHGGELSGSVDEPNRHAITRFAHIHLVASRQHASLLTAMGEERSRIYIIGSPGLDDIISHNYVPPTEVAKKYKVDRRSPHLLLVQHPVVTERDLAATQVRRTLEAVVRVRVQTTAIYPNADAGGRAMIKVLRAYARKNRFIHLYRNIRRDEYLGLMACSSVMVGNSSSGIIEAASFGLPAVNIGTRQQGRIHPANVIDVGHDTGRIAAAIRRGLSQSLRNRIGGLKNPYGDGHTGEKVAEILAQVKPTPALLQKRLTFRMEHRSN